MSLPIENSLCIVYTSVFFVARKKYPRKVFYELEAQRMNKNKRIMNKHEKIVDGKEE